MTKKIATKTALKSSLPNRPPVVVILGHIDHGKTTLLSKIKEIDLARKEHGGITQHIAAYRVKVKEKEGKASQEITFIDTPGHAAFNEMRSRGAKIADLALLVVAANEGIKPQTRESLKYINEAGLNYLVALNKIDLNDISLDRAKKDLVDNEILIEEYGGKIVLIPTSAKTGKGVNDLLEMILLLGEMMNLKGSNSNPLKAVVLESKLDNRKGPLATILVRDGSLKIGDKIKAGKIYGKIKAMFDERGNQVKEALVSQPVEILGFKDVPLVGEKIEKTKIQKEEIEEDKKQSFKIEEVKEGEETKKLKIILKADVVGTLEAIKNNLPENCQILKAGVGAVNDSDVLLAQGSKAEISTFNVKLSGKVKKLAETEKVKITTYNVIYELLEDIEKKALKVIEPTIDEKILGRAEILERFEMKENVAGCKVIEGEIKRGDRIHLLRGKEILGDVRVKTMKKGKEDTNSVVLSEEFGIIFSPELDFKIGDVLVSYRKSEA